jgi:hypothetical protein
VGHRRGAAAAGARAGEYLQRHPLEAVEALRQRVMAGLAPYVDPRMADHASNVSRTPYEAYREYAEGMELYLNARGGGEARKALEHFSRAAAHDSAFTLPLVRSASIHVLASNYAAADSITRLLEPRMDRLAEFDRQVITACRCRWRSSRAGARSSSFRLHTSGCARMSASAATCSPVPARSTKSFGVRATASRSRWSYAHGCCGSDSNRTRSASASSLEKRCVPGSRSTWLPSATAR